MTKKFFISKYKFIEEANKIHNSKYLYSCIDTDIIDYKTPISIICPTHGLFYQPYVRHIKHEAGCKKCAVKEVGNNRRTTKEEYLFKFKQKFGDYYDYNNANFIDGKSKIIIICPIHGEFKQIPSEHVKSNGCPKCTIIEISNKNRRTLEEFINEATKIHNGKYDYSAITDYINSDTKLPIICHKHGMFMQAPYNHLIGSGKGGPAGCHKCFTSTGETKIREFLEKYNIEYISQYRYKDCIYKKPLAFDFYLPEFNSCVEYDGEQHFKPIIFGSMTSFDADDNLKLCQIKDNIKNNYCANNNISLLRISYLEKHLIDKLLIGFLKINLIHSGKVF